MAAAETTPAELPASLLDFSLPVESHLLLAGYKKINLSVKRKLYPNRADNNVEEELLLKQQLKLRALGIMARKFYLDIDYDDTREDTSQDSIALFYTGDADEYLAEAALGDLKLRLPGSEFVVYERNVFGAKFHLVIDDEKSMMGAEEKNKPLYEIPRRADFTSGVAQDPRFTLRGSPVLLSKRAPVYPNIELTVLGSRTRGMSVEREFSGKQEEKTSVIHDTAYEVRKFYRVYSTENELPLKRGSEHVYLDDGDGYNNEDTVTLADWPGYDFDSLTSGQDYFINYQTGILTLRKPLGRNMALAIVADSAVTQIRRLLKGEDSYSVYELRNRYFLGAYNIDRSRFVLRIADSAGRELDLKNYPHVIDYEAGLLTFNDPNPFSLPDYPHPEDWQRQLLLRFRETVRVYILHPGIIRGSEKITIDKRELTRDQDYLLDFESGVLTFLSRVELTKDSKITVTYEYLPFGGSSAKTLIGAQVGFNWLAENGIRFTVMEEKADLLDETPLLGSAPDSTRLVDLAGSLRYQGTEFKASLSGEWAGSVYQHNIMDRAYVDSFEDGLLRLELDMDKKDWQISSAPLSASGSRQDYQLSNSGEDHDDKDDQGSLEIRYQLGGAANWVALNAVIDEDGVDITEKSYVVMWVYGDGSGVSLNLDLGQINEDADGDGILDSEDDDENGRLSSGEDDGFSFDYNMVSEMIGSGNGRLDTEDLDGDGRLDVLNENYLELNTNINWVGWRKVVLYLDTGTAQPTQPVDLRNVKTMRLWLSGAADGRILIESIHIAGHRWQEGRLDDSGTHQLDGEISGSFLVDEADKNSGTFFNDKNEHSLKLDYSLPASTTGYTRIDYLKKKDFSGYRELNFEACATVSSKLFLRLLTSEDDYYEWQGLVENTDFREFSISLKDDDQDQVPDGFVRVGEANLADIRSIAVGVINQSGAISNGVAYLDNIHLFGSVSKQAEAYKVALSLSSGDNWSLNAARTIKQAGFQTIGAPVVKQNEETYLLSGEWNLPFSPVYGSWEHEELAALPDPFDGIPSQDQNQEIYDEKRLGGRLVLTSQPQILRWELNHNRNQRRSYGADHQTRSVNLNSSIRAPADWAESLELRTRARVEESSDEYYRDNIYEENRRIIERSGLASISYRPLKRWRLTGGHEKLASVIIKQDLRPLRRVFRSYLNTSYYSTFGIDPRASWQERSEEFFTNSFKKEARLNDKYGLGARFTLSQWLDVNPMYLDLDYRFEERGRFVNVSGYGHKYFVELMNEERKVQDKRLEGLKVDRLINYYSLKSYQSNCQWEVFDYLRLLSDYGFSKERARDEGSVTLIERSVFKSNLDLDLKKMSSYVLMAGFNLIPSYQVANRVTILEKRNLDQLRKMTALIRWRDNLQTTTSYEQAENIETSLADKRAARVIKRRSPVQSLYYRWKDTLVFRIPFTSKRYTLTNRLELRSSYQRTEVRVSDLKDTDETNKDDYKLNLKYYFTSLITLTFGGTWQTFENLTRNIEDYTEQNLQVQVEALF